MSDRNKKSPAIRGLNVSIAEARELHGHLCPGLVMGYKASIRAMEELRPAPDHSLAVTVFEACGCPVDAIRAVTGCSKETKNLRIIDRKEASFLFSDKSAGVSIRIALLPEFDLARIDRDWSRLRKLINSGQATGEEKEQFESVNDHVCGLMLNLPDEAMFFVGVRKPIRKR
jgi:formylmethanofuran dehydrogenase subunit E